MTKFSIEKSAKNIEWRWCADGLHATNESRKLVLRRGRDILEEKISRVY